MPKAPCGAFLVWAKVLERVMGKKSLHHKNQQNQQLNKMTA